MFNDDMRNIARSLYLQTRHFRAELLLDGVERTKLLFFGLRFIDRNHWAVTDLEFDIKQDNILHCVYSFLSLRLNKEGDHGIVMLIDNEKKFKGVLYGIEGMLAQYSSKHDDLLTSYSLYDMDNCENEGEGLYSIKSGDPILKPSRWNEYMNIDSEH